MPSPRPHKFKPDTRKIEERDGKFVVVTTHWKDGPHDEGRVFDTRVEAHKWIMRLRRGRG